MPQTSPPEFTVSVTEFRLVRERLPEDAQTLKSTLERRPFTEGYLSSTLYRPYLLTPRTLSWINSHLSSLGFTDALPPGVRARRSKHERDVFCVTLDPIQQCNANSITQLASIPFSTLWAVHDTLLEAAARMIVGNPNT